MPNVLTSIAAALAAELRRQATDGRLRWFDPESDHAGHVIVDGLVDLDALAAAAIRAIPIAPMAPGEEARYTITVNNAKWGEPHKPTPGLRGGKA